MYPENTTLNTDEPVIIAGRIEFGITTKRLHKLQKLTIVCTTEAMRTCRTVLPRCPSSLHADVGKKSTL